MRSWCIAWTVCSTACCRGSWRVFSLWGKLWWWAACVCECACGCVGGGAGGDFEQTSPLPCPARRDLLRLLLVLVIDRQLLRLKLFASKHLRFYVQAHGPGLARNSFRLFLSSMPAGNGFVCTLTSSMWRGRGVVPSSPPHPPLVRAFTTCCGTSRCCGAQGPQWRPRER